jgi:hypothetical protein
MLVPRGRERRTITLPCGSDAEAMEDGLMMENWDPLVMLMVKGLGYLLLIGVICTVLYLVIKYAVSAGIKLAADDLRDVPGASRPE